MQLQINYVNLTTHGLLLMARADISSSEYEQEFKDHRQWAIRAAVNGKSSTTWSQRFRKEVPESKKHEILQNAMVTMMKSITTHMASTNYIGQIEESSI